MTNNIKLPVAFSRFATLAVASVSIATASLLADPVIYSSTFETDTLLSETPEITPTSTNWYVMSSKNATGSAIGSASGLYLNMGSTSSGATEGVATFANSAFSLSDVGDYIQATVDIYPQNVRTFVMGFYNSGGVAPYTTLNNGGLSSANTITTGGTLNWVGYRAGLDSSTATSADFATRPAQVTASTQQAQDVVNVGTGGYSWPGKVGVGTQSASITNFTGYSDYNLYTITYRIEKTNTDEYTMTYTVVDGYTTETLYSAQGVTTAAGALPSAATNLFDSFAVGYRNLASATSECSVTRVAITGSNAHIAHFVVPPADQSFIPGQNASIALETAGDPTLVYEWTKDGSTLPETSSTYSIASVTSGDAGVYTAKVSNDLGYDLSQEFTVSVVSAQAPSFTTQPQSQTVNAGESFTLTAEASGAPTPTYQWYHGTTPIPDATYPTYTVDTAAESDGGTYKVVATNTSGTKDSNVATVTIYTEAPSISVGPQSATGVVGDQIILSVTAAGVPTPTYQWLKNGDPIPDATHETYTVPNATTDDAGTFQYTVKVTNYLNFVESDPATVQIDMVAPSISIQPASQTVNAGQTIALTVKAAGSPNLSYQWYKGTNMIPGATESSYTVESATLSNAGTYTVKVTNAADFVVSDPAEVTVNNAQISNIFSTNFASDVILTSSSDTPVQSTTSTSWYLASSKNATASTVGDDPATTDVVEERPLNLTLTATTTSGIMEAATVFTDTPVELTKLGDFLKVRANVTINNVRYMGVGLYNSHGSKPYPEVVNGGLSNGKTDYAVGGVAPWTGYRALMYNNTGVDSNTSVLDARTAQPGNSNSEQDLVVPGTSSSFERTGVAPIVIQTVPNTQALLNVTDGLPYILEMTVTMSAEDQYTIICSLLDASTEETVYTAGTATAVDGTSPSAIATAFDSFAIGLRNRDNTSLPSITMTSLEVSFGTATEGGPQSAYDTYVTGYGLDPATDGAMAANPSGDGISNLMKFVLGGDPTKAESSILPMATHANGTLTFVYNLKDAALTDFDVVVEYSADLSSWSVAQDGQGGVAVQVSAVDAETSQVTVTIPDAGNRGFARLKVMSKQ